MKAEMYKTSYWTAETRPDVLVGLYEDLLDKSGFHVLKRSEQFFAPFGFIVVWILGESHLAIHTFPEEGKAYVELTSCVKDYFDNFEYFAEIRNLKLENV